MLERHWPAHPEANDPRRGSRGRWIGVGVLVILAAVFSFLNAGERVSLNVGFATLFRISLVGLVFAAFLLGMFAMFLFGLRHDIVVRNALRDAERRSSPPPTPEPYQPPEQRSSPPSTPEAYQPPERRSSPPSTPETFQPPPWRPD